MRIALLPSERGGSYKFVMILLASIGLLISSLPVLIIVLMSFSGAESVRFPPTEFSIHWYQIVVDMLTSEDSSSAHTVIGSLFTSLKIAAIVMFISAVVTVPLAYALARSMPGKIKAGMELLFTLPLVFPLVILGISFLLIAESLRWDMGIWRLVIPHLALVIPFVLRNCLSAMNGINRELEEAAISLGATPFKAAIDIVIPLMKPGILAGMIFALIISFNEFTITFFMYTIDVSTLPIWMYSRTVSSLDPSTLALSVLIVLVDVFLIVIIDKIIAGRSSLF